MPQLFLLLQQSSKSSSDSSFQSLKRVTPNLFFTTENPIFLAILILVVILAVTFIYYRYVIIPMRKKHLREKENMRLQQAELMALFSELSPDPVFRFEKDGKITLANNSAHQIFREHKLLGMDVRDVLGSLSKLDLTKIIEGGQHLNFMTKLGNSHYQFIVTGVPKLEICQVYGRDIEDLKKKEQELQDALEKVEDAKKIKEEFLAQMSHEIRSPLNVIEGYAQYLNEELNDELKEEYADVFQSIKNNSKRLYRTVDLILNMSQIQTGGYEATFETLDLNKLLKNIYQEFESFAEEKNLDFQIVNQNVKPAFVYADYYSLRQIFINLLDNAFKYTEQGKVEIILKIEERKVTVDIKDTGIGMEKKYLDELFTPFSQERKGYSRKYEGTGLGLALVKSFVDFNHADITVISQLNGGSTFSLIFKEE